MKALRTLLLGLPLLLLSCDSSSDRTQIEYVTTIVRQAADGLDLQAVTDLATKVKTAEEFETSLNDPARKINNLDLNEDDLVDYIKVTEIQDGDIRGFSLTTELGEEEDDEQELAVIQFEKGANEEVTVQTHGNSHIYGNNYYYHRRTSIGDVLLWSYLFSPHRGYYSSWGYNRYPPSYSRYRTSTYDSYRGHHQGQSYSKNVAKSSAPAVSKPIKSPNFNKTSSKIKAPLKNPTASQKSFQTRNPSKQITRSKGFGSSKPKSSSTVSKSSSSAPKSSKTTSSYRSGSSSSRSRSSFGGGK